MEINCKDHNEQAHFMCISNHECGDRWLCAKCIHESHKNVPKEETITIEQYANLGIQKLKSLPNSKASYYREMMKAFETKLNITLTSFTNNIEQFIKEIEKTDNHTADLLFQLEKDLMNILRFSRKDQELMSSIVINNTIGQLQTIQEEAFKVISVSIETCLSDIDLLNSKITQKYSEQHVKNITLEGQMILGIKHGDFQYLEQGISIHVSYSNQLQAGKYSFGVKEGIWEELIDSDEGKLKAQFVEYQNGKQIKILNKFGETNQFNKKQGQWLETSGFEQAIGMRGFYENGIRVGQWQALLYGYLQGGGFYDETGKQNGFWTEIEQQISISNCFYLLQGEYLNGSRNGQWQIGKDQLLIGQGQFDQNNKKTGLWEEFDGQFGYSGNYQNGQQVGEWIITQNNQRMYFMTLTSGGGNYNERGQKHGKWTELDFKNKKILLSGEYRSGRKSGFWVIINEEKIMYILTNNSGGGSYGENGLKVGEWTEIGDLLQGKLSGQYQSGLRTGFWTIYLDDQIFGGGYYDSQGRKQGDWTEIDNLSLFQFSGKYQQGQRVGEWNILNEGQIIGGGEYNGKGQKQGPWKDYQNNNRQQKFAGHYDESGRKIGIWKIFECGTLMGQGSFDVNGQKEGQWTEFQIQSMETFVGEYKSGKRVGKWEIYVDKQKKAEGFYNEQEQQHGKWIEFDEDMRKKGEYFNGKKIGEWVVIKNDRKIESISYDNDGNEISSKIFNQ